MFRDPDVVIDETVENLKLLAEFFGDAVDVLSYDQEQTKALHKCREARSAIIALIPKLCAARDFDQIQRRRPSACLDCD